MIKKWNGEKKDEKEGRKINQRETEL